MNTLSPRNRASETPSPNSRPCARPPSSRACGLRVAAWLALSGALFIAAPANAQLAFTDTVPLIEHELDNVGDSNNKIEVGPTVTTTLPEATGGTGTVTYACISFRHPSTSSSQFGNCPEARGITFIPGTRELILNSTRRTSFTGQAIGIAVSTGGTNYTAMFTATDTASPPAVVTLTVTIKVYRPLIVQGRNFGNFRADGQPFPNQSTSSPSHGKGPYTRHADLQSVDSTGTVTTFSNGMIVLDSDTAIITFSATGTGIRGRFFKAASGNIPYWATDSLGGRSSNVNFAYNATAVAPTLAAIPDIEFAASDVRSQTLPAASGTSPITYAVSIPTAAASWLKADTAPAEGVRALSITVGTAAENDTTVITYTATNSGGTATQEVNVSVTGALQWMDAGNYPTDLTFNRFVDGNDDYAIQGQYTLPAASGGDGGPYAYDLVRGTSNNPVHWLLNLQSPNAPTRIQVDSDARAGDYITLTYTATETIGGSSIVETFNVYVIASLRLQQSNIFFELGTPKQETLSAATGGAGAYTYGLTGQDDAAWLEADVSSADNTPPVLSIIHTGANAAVNGDSQELTYTVSNTTGAVTTVFNVEVNALLGITADNLTFVAGDLTAQALPAASGGDGEPYTYALTGQAGLNWLSVAHSDNTAVPMISITNAAVGGETATLIYSATDSSGTEMATFTITVFSQVTLGTGNPVFLTFTTGDDSAETLAIASGGGGAPYLYDLDTIPNWLLVDSGDGSTPPTLSLNISGANAAVEADTVTLTYSAETAVHAMTVTVNIEVIDELALAQAALQFNINDLNQTETLSAATGGNKGPYTYTITGDPFGNLWLTHTNSNAPTAAPILQSTTSDARSGMLTYTVTDATGNAEAIFVVTAIDTLGFSGGEPADLTYTVGEDNSKALPVGAGGTSPYAYLLAIPPTDATWLLADFLSGATPPTLSIATGTPAAGDSDSTTITYTITDSATPTPNTFVSLIEVGVAAVPVFTDNTEPVFVFTAGQRSEFNFQKVTDGASPITYTIAFVDPENILGGTPAPNWLAEVMTRTDGTPYISGTPPSTTYTIATGAGNPDAYRFPVTAIDGNAAEAYLGGTNGVAYLIVRRAPTAPTLPTFSATPLILDTNAAVAFTFTGAPTDSVQTDTGSNIFTAADKDLLATPLVQELILSVDGAAVATFSSTSAFDSSAATDAAAHSQTLSAAQLVHSASTLTFNSLGFVTYTETLGGTAYTYGFAPQFEVIGEPTDAGRYAFEFKVTDKNGATASSSGGFAVSTGAGWGDVAEVDNGHYSFTINVPIEDAGKMTVSLGTTFPEAESLAAQKPLTYGALTAISPNSIGDWIDYTANTEATDITFAPHSELFTSATNRAEKLTFTFSVPVTDKDGNPGDILTMVVVVNEVSEFDPPSWDGHPGFYLVEVDSPSTLVDPATEEPYTQPNGEFYIAEEGDENPDPRAIPLSLTHTQGEDLKVTSANPHKDLTYSALTWLNPVAADADSDGLPAVLGIEYTGGQRASTDALPISFTVNSGNAKFQADCAQPSAKVCPFQESYEFEVSVTDIDSNTVILTFTVNLRENELPPPRATLTPPQGHYFEINRIIMSQIGEAIVSDTVNVITDRLGSVRLQQTDAEPYFGVGGESAPSKIIARNAKGLVDGTTTPKQLLNGARLVLPLIGEYGAPLPSGMAFWISANHSDMSADTDIVNWEGDMRNIYFGVDSTVSPRAVMGMAFNRANVEIDYEDLRTAPGTGEEKEYAGIGKYEIDLTGINPYVSWRHGKVDLWVTLGQSVGDLTITRFEEEDREKVIENDGVKTNLRLKTAAAGGTGLWATDGDSQLRVRGEVFTSRMEIDAAETNRGKDLDKQYDIGTVAQTVNGGLVRLGLELVNPDILPGGARMEPMYEFGARYDYGESEVGGGIEAATGLRFSGAKNQVSGIFRLHGVTTSDGAYDEWGAYALLRNRAGGDGQGLSLDLRPSYGADDRIDLWQAALETAHQTALDPSQYAMQMDARIGYGITGGRGLFTPFTEWTHRDYDTYRLGVDWSPRDDFTLNLIGETEQLPSGNQQSVLLQGTINF